MHEIERALGCADGVAGQIGEHGVRGQVIEQRLGAVKEQRQVELDPRRRDAVAHAAIDRAARRVALETRAIAAAKGAHGIGVERHFARRQQTHRLERLARALGLRIEAADRFDLIVEQIDAQRRIGAHGEYVEQRAAQGELAGVGHLRDARVTGFGQPQAKRLERERVADGEREAATGDVLARWQTLQQGIDRHQQQAARERRQFREREQTLGSDVGVRRIDIVGQHFPVRQHDHRQLRRREEAQFRAAAFEAARIGLDDDPGPGVGGGRLGQGEGGRAGVQTAPAHARAPGIGYEGS